ncbi:MAG: PD40 domain-containing protein [Ardenticatenales bacterium]|nr:PD40 domain-containing protein [Ardenticatenales bacterium]
MSGAAAAARAATLYVSMLTTAMLVAACGADPVAPDDFGGPGDGSEIPSTADESTFPNGTAFPNGTTPPARVGARHAVPTPTDLATTGGSAASRVAPIGPPGLPIRLTDGGCCVRPLWRADSRALWFIDRSPQGVTGLYSAALDAPGAPTALVTTTIGTFSPDQRWRIDLASGRTTLHRLADGAAFEVPAGGRSVSFSPDGARIAWQGSNPNASLERQVARIVVAAPDGTGAAEVAQLARGSLVDWLGADALLVRARETAESDIEVLWRQPLDGGERVEILRTQRLRNLLLSPDKRWLAYTVSGATDVDANGLWLAAADGSSPPRKLEGLFGAYRWRGAQQLVIVPFEMGAPSMRLVEVDPTTLAARPLTDPATQPLRIANGDWSISPDGSHAAFVSAADRNIWVIALP